LFRKLSQVIADAAVSEVEAGLIALNAHNACAAGLEQEALAGLERRLPRLEHIRSILEAEGQRKSLLMLATILDASAPPVSGELPAAPTILPGTAVQ
jgi:hypothetical protein